MDVGIAPGLAQTSGSVDVRSSDNGYSDSAGQDSNPALSGQYSQYSDGPRTHADTSNFSGYADVSPPIENNELGVEC